MKTEVICNGEHELIDELQSFLAKHQVFPEETENIVRASSTPTRRRSVTFINVAETIVTGILEMLKNHTDQRLDVQIGTTTTMLSRQESATKLQETISIHKGVRVVFTRSTD